MLCLEGHLCSAAGSNRRAAGAHLEEAEEHGRVDAIGQRAWADATEHAGHAALQDVGHHFDMLAGSEMWNIWRNDKCYA